MDLSSVLALIKKINAGNYYGKLGKATEGTRTPDESAKAALKFIKDNPMVVPPFAEGGIQAVGSAAKLVPAIDTRPAHQALLEKAANSGNVKELQRILNSIPKTDPYKISMESIFRPMIQRALQIVK